MKVSISCITYNHAPYIRECIEGFLMQKCDFDYEILIHDDASTDGTQEIIKEYVQKNPDLIKPIYQTENQYSKGVRGINVKFNFPQAKGEYIALCEGDDYWTDPLKLQKQVDFLEENEDVVACGTYIDVMKESLEKSASLMQLQKFTTIDLLKGNWIPTLTNVFRKTALHNPISEIVDDFTLLANISSKGGYMVKLPFISAIYRYHGGGVVSGQTPYNNWKRNFGSVYIFASKYKSHKFTKQAMKNCVAVFNSEIRKNIRADYKIFVLTSIIYLRLFTLLRK